MKRKAVIVTGAASGIGAAIARAFQDAGAKVAITGAEPEPAPVDCARFQYTQLDVTDGAAVRAFGANRVRLDVLVNCAAITARTDPAHVAAVSARTPMGRWGQPEDIAGPVLFLASKAAGFMTGTCLAIDGGYSIA